MNAAYGAKTIEVFICSRKRIPIIDPNKRNDEDRPPLDPAKKERHKMRSTVERANAHLKDNLIPKAIYVKGYTKVSFVLMSSVLGKILNRVKPALKKTAFTFICQHPSDFFQQA